MPTSASFGSQGPVFKVEGEVQGELARDLVELEVEEDLDGLKKLRACFGNWNTPPGASSPDFFYFDGRVLDFGKELEVSIGPFSESRVIFRGTLSALEAQHEEAREPLAVALAEDRLMNLRMTRRFKTYENVADAEIAESIAGEHGLSAEVDASGPSYPMVQQWNQSDLAFLRERARLLNAEVWLDDTTLYFQTRGARIATELTLVQGSDLLSARIRADLAHQRTEVKVSGYDAQARESIEETAGSDVVQAEVASGRLGPEVLERAFGQRTSYRVREVPLSTEEAQSWAKAEMLRRSRSFVQVSGVARGQPDMVVGSKLSLVRVGTPFEGGDYYVTRVLHQYSPAAPGFRTYFEAERGTLSESSR